MFGWLIGMAFCYSFWCNLWCINVYVGYGAEG